MHNEQKVMSQNKGLLIPSTAMILNDVNYL